ncbi:MAG: helix-turn-helix transcriptional regulator [Anaerolineales bacterium]|nr:helix-turn-helix transcriptional regulator [Anaerolineales bacterium]
MQVISAEARLEILLAIGAGEACVCHLEAVLGYRQAYISQQLMTLREAGLLGTRRDGRYIFYRLEKPEILQIVELAARLEDLDLPAVDSGISLARSSCECPRCCSQVPTRTSA